MPLDRRLIDILVCPICKGKLDYKKSTGEFICKLDRLAFPVQNDIPIMLEKEARMLAADEKI